MKALKSPSKFSQEFSSPRRPPIASWGEADSALAQLGKLERAQARLAAHEEAALARLQRRRGELAARRQELTSALENFCRTQAVETCDGNGHRTTLLEPRRRSRRLLFGRLGFHRVHRLEVREPERAVQLLSRNGLGARFLRVERQLDREALHRALVAGANGGGKHPRQMARGLARAGIRLETRDAFFYELHPQAVARWS